MSEPTRFEAKAIIDQLGQKGLPPDPSSIRRYSVGIEGDMSAFDREYLGEDGGLGGPPIPGMNIPRVYSFLISARNGEGKTHYVYALLDRAYQQHYVGSYVELDASSTPLSNDFAIYQAVVDGVRAPEGGTVNMAKRGLDRVLQAWLNARRSEIDADHPSPREALLSQIDSLEFDTPVVEYKRAVREYLKRVAVGKQDEADSIYAWLAGQAPAPPKLDAGPAFSKLDKTKGATYIACVTQILRGLGYQGTLLVFDEAEAAVLPTKDQLAKKGSRKKALEALFNFLKLVRQPANLGANYCMVLYCTTDAIEGMELHPALRTAFLEPKTFFSERTPSGSFIDLAGKYNGPEATKLLRDLAERIADLYQIAYGRPQALDDAEAKRIAREAADEVIARPELSGRMRVLVRTTVQLLHERGAGKDVDHAAIQQAVGSATPAPYLDPSEGEL